MRPILFYLGDYPIFAYRALLAVAILAGHRVFSAHASRRQLDPRRALELQILLVLAGLFGSRLIEVALFWDFYGHNPDQILRFWSSGLTFYGGLLLAFPICAAFTRAVGWSLLEVLDMLAPAVAVGLAIGRLGCLLAGCCYGMASELPWALAFPRAGESIPRHPTQAYEMLACFAIFLVLQRSLAGAGRPAGWVIALFACLYGGFRFTVEFWREDPRGGLFFGLFSFSQLVSIGIVGAAAVWLVARRRPGGAALAESPAAPANEIERPTLRAR
ncbi:MAG: prolipoprotein diacylglyceryl transferase [Candidatus Wallbacteria bacterium]|nr:prolipoprotein diacylglyceryl transferase [Candidatus Wallbacteria bacterium]